MWEFMSINFWPEDFYPKDYPRVYPPRIDYSISEPKPEDPNHTVVHIVLSISPHSIYVIIIEIVITRADSGNKDYYYDSDRYDNSLGNTPLSVDKYYSINIVPPKNPGDTEQVNIYGSYI